MCGSLGEKQEMSGQKNKSMNNLCKLFLEQLNDIKTDIQVKEWELYIKMCSSYTTGLIIHNDDIIKQKFLKLIENEIKTTLNRAKIMEEMK